jgi:hypothetical protein
MRTLLSEERVINKIFPVVVVKMPFLIGVARDSSMCLVFIPTQSWRYHRIMSTNLPTLFVFCGSEDIILLGKLLISLSFYN